MAPLTNSLWQFDTARGQKIANAVKTRLPVEVESVVGGKIEGSKCFTSLVRTFLKVFVEHLFPTRRVELGGIRNHTVEVKEHCFVLTAADQAPVLGLLPHRSHSSCDVRYRLHEHQTLSASVERMPTDAASCPHVQPVISGMS